MRREIRIAGFGGQGVITVGILLAKALGQYGNAYVAQSQSYGPEARGGACKTDLVASSSEIDYIKPLRLDVLAAMSQPALDLYAASLPKNGDLVVDTSLVTVLPQHAGRVLGLAAAVLAEQEVGVRMAANVVMFGALARVTGWTESAACRQALADTFPEKSLEKNYAAFELGYAAVREVERS